MSAAEKLSPAPDAPMIEYAVDYAKRGFAVFPCKPANKAPYTAAGLNDATTDELTVKRWWQQWPHAMIGVRMGAASGVWAIDPDAPKEPGAPDGRKTWAELIQKHGAVHTHAHLTPGDGQHLLFKWNPDKPVRNREGALKGTGINVRGEGGYVIAPPSRRADGKAYQVAEPLDYFSFADAPDWLYELIATKPEPSISQIAVARVSGRVNGVNGLHPYVAAAVDGELHAVATANPGERNNVLNAAAFSLGTLVGSGELTEGEAIDALLDGAIQSGLVAEDGHRATLATIRSGLGAGMKSPRQIPEQERPATRLQSRQSDGNEGERACIQATPYAWREPHAIPRRDWLYGRLLVRQFVSATVAPGGVGKSSLIAAEALAMVSGKPLLGVTSQRLNVWPWNLEDPQDETARKIQATAKRYGLKPDDIGDRLFVDSGRDQRLVIAEQTRNGAMIVRPVVDSLVAEIKARGIDVVIIDPFVSSHAVPENDNNGQDAVVKEWAKVADRTGCAVHLIDHTRKVVGGDAEVTTESARGGKAKTDACRVVRVLNRMSKDEGEKAGVENHRLYFRAYNDKANLAPPADESDWYKLESVDLENGTALGPGDSVGVVHTWEWPDAMAGVTGGDFDRVAASIRAGKWRESAQASDWVGKAVAHALDLDPDNKADKAKIKGMLKVWLAAGSLAIVEAQDEKRMTRKFVEVAYAA